MRTLWLRFQTWRLRRQMTPLQKVEEQCDMMLADLTGLGGIHPASRGMR